jgi:hypothetical protein
MADQGQQQQPARQGGAPRRGGGNATANRTPATVFLNPERAPPLLSKWQKLLGKDLDKIEVIYEENGITVNLYGKEGTSFHNMDEDGNPLPMSCTEYKETKARVTAPSGEDAIFAFRNKFEVRLNLPFPEGLDLGDGSEAAIRRAVQALPFEHRRVMLMSNKQYKTAYPNGFAGAAGAAA